MNLSPFNLYPDSYQTLLVAENITDYQSVAGSLGTGGIFFPSDFSWSHPIYPMLIDIVNIPSQNLTLSARLVAFLASILAIPLSFLLTKRIFSGAFYGLSSAFLLAFSFNHTVWGGFVMTETTGIFLLLLFLVSFFTNKPQKFGNIQDVLSGVLFSFCVMTRYEYIVLLFPLMLYYLFNGKQLMRLATILLSFVLTMSLFFWQLYPFPGIFLTIYEQLRGVILREGVVLFFLFIMSFLLLFISRETRFKIEQYGMYCVTGAIWTLGILLTMQLIIGSKISLFWNDFFALRRFLFHDTLLSIFAFAGFILLLKNQRTKAIGLFAFFSFMSLFIIYHRVNPSMERYFTHTIPFFLIPASYALSKMIRHLSYIGMFKKYTIYIILIILVIMQGVITFSGMRYDQDPSWFRLSYEDKSAALVRKYVSNNKYLLLTSYPEPYYYLLHLGTQTIVDTYPYIFLDDTFDERKVLIINDMGMHRDFPKFTYLVERHLSKNKIASFYVHEKFHYVDSVQEEKYPVSIYVISIHELKKTINEYNYN